MELLELKNLNEAVKGRRESNASILLTQLSQLGVKVNPDTRDQMVVELSKVIDLLPYSSISLIYSGLLAPVLTTISKFDTYPIKLKDLDPLMEKATDFKYKGDQFPNDIYEKLVKYKFFKWESLRQQNDALMFSNNNVKDFIHYLLVMGLSKGKLGG